jgi:hypothetical protein
LSLRFRFLFRSYSDKPVLRVGPSSALLEAAKRVAKEITEEIVEDIGTVAIEESLPRIGIGIIIGVYNGILSETAFDNSQLACPLSFIFPSPQSSRTHLDF